MLTPLEKLDLQDRLDELLVTTKTAKGLDLLDVNDQIDEVMTKLGFAGDSTPVSSPQNADNSPLKSNKPDIEPPQIVANFLAGEYQSVQAPELVDALNQVREYVGVFIGIEQLAEQCSKWQSHHGYAIG